MVDIKLSMADILARDDVADDVLQKLKKNWPLWGAGRDVNPFEIARWAGQEHIWYARLRKLPDTLSGLKKMFSPNGLDKGLCMFLEFLQAFTGLATLDKKQRTPLTCVLAFADDDCWNALESLSHRLWQNADVCVLEFLLRLKDVHPEDDDRVIVSAVQDGQHAVVALLLADGRCDVAVRDSYALASAMDNADVAMVKLLVDDGRCNSDLALMQSHDFVNAAMAVNNAKDALTAINHNKYARYEEITRLFGWID